MQGLDKGKQQQQGTVLHDKSYNIAMNEDGKKREGSIIFSNGSLTETVHIYQAGDSIILLSRNDCHVSASVEEITVELRSNYDYEISCLLPVE